MESTLRRHRPTYVLWTGPGRPPVAVCSCHWQQPLHRDRPLPACPPTISRPTDDPCGMEVGHGLRCTLPGDHGGGCRAPRCKCSHAASSHSTRTGDCWAYPCGCGRFEVREVAA